VHRVVIVGGGFAGLYAAKALNHAPVEVTLVDRRNFHLFQPLLYQVATGGLSPGEIALPLRVVLRRQRNTRVWLAEAIGFDVAARRVILADGEAPYDTLIVATGVSHHYFGNPHWEEVAPGLKTIEDATRIRRRILLAFEAAEREPDPEKKRAWLTFVVVGAGPTGVELAGAIGEIANDTLRRDFRATNTAESRILLVEAADRVLPLYPPDLSLRAERSLVGLAVRSLTKTFVTSIDDSGVEVKSEDRHWKIPSRTVLWAAGVQASALGRVLAERTGARLDPAGRVMVEPDLSLPGHPEIFVLGDLGNFSHQGGKPLPGVAPVAMQQGRYVADLIERRLRGEAAGPFRYCNKGNLATIGRSAAVADFGWTRFSGWFAWMLWLFVHLLYLAGFENRVLVLIRWAFSYFTHNRGARLITGPTARNHVS